ncbi:MAG: PepSY domain-containing protein [Miltoncostaeaceae bacterium]
MRPDEAVAIALAHVGAGSTLIEIQREEDDLAWEVKVRPAAAFIRDVESVPNGTVVDAKIDD